MLFVVVDADAYVVGFLVIAHLVNKKLINTMQSHEAAINILCVVMKVSSLMEGTICSRSSAWTTAIIVPTQRRRCCSFILCMKMRSSRWVTDKIHA